MKTRRQFITFNVKFLSGLGMFLATLGGWLENVYAKAKRPPVQARIPDWVHH